MVGTAWGVGGWNAWQAQTEADADDLEAVEVGRRACRTARPGLALALPLGGLCFLLAVVFMSPQMLMVKSNSAQSVQKSEVEGKAGSCQVWTPQDWKLTLKGKFAKV